MPLRGTTFRIGRTQAGDTDVAIYFRPQLCSLSDLKDLASALQQELLASRVLVVTGRGSYRFAKRDALELPDVVRINAETGDMSPLPDV